MNYLTSKVFWKVKYPAVLVQDDVHNMVVEDGKIISSNGSLVSYIASLDLLEKMSNKAHRNYVEDQLYLKRLKNAL